MSRTRGPDTSCEFLLSRNAHISRLVELYCRCAAQVHLCVYLRMFAYVSLFLVKKKKNKTKKDTVLGNDGQHKGKKVETRKEGEKILKYDAKKYKKK